MVNYDENDLIYNDYINTTTNGDNPDYTAIRDRERVSKMSYMKWSGFAMLLLRIMMYLKQKQVFKELKGYSDYLK